MSTEPVEVYWLKAIRSSELSTTLFWIVTFVDELTSIPSINELLAALKPEWKVAMQAILMRACSLKFATDNQARYLWQQISARGWRTREPAELDFPREAPKVLPSIVATHITELGYSIEQLTTLMRIHEPEFTAMYGIHAPATSNQKPRLRIVN